jgi:glycerol kinase
MVRSPGLLTSIAWSSDSGRSYVLEGTVNAVGSGLAWLQRTWRLPNDLRALDRLARRSRRPTPFLPALAGLGAPDWDPLAEGIASGFTLASEPQDVVQGFLDGVAFLLARVVAAMPATVPAARITASGGLSELSALLQSQADFLGCPIRRARLRETSAWGAAALCGVGAGLWRSPDEAARRVPYDRLFHPSAEENSVNRKKRVWERLLREAQRIGVYTAVSHSE